MVCLLANKSDLRFSFFSFGRIFAVVSAVGNIPLQKNFGCNGGTELVLSLLTCFGIGSRELTLYVKT